MEQHTAKAIIGLYVAIAVAGISIAGVTAGEARTAVFVFAALFGVGLLTAAAYDRATRTPEPLSSSSTRGDPWSK